MDSSNNTPEIIDSNIGILDTYVEPVRGMGILIHRTTILRTGAIATGNFI
jgi:tetrahydromethanopterin S-methyltransferase subunit F